MVLTEKEAMMAKAKQEIVVTETFAQQVIALTRNYDADTLAERAGVSPATIYHWRAGAVQNPRSDTLIKVAKAMGYRIALERVTRLQLVKG